VMARGFLLVAVLGVVGCGSGMEGSPPPPPMETATLKATATPTATRVPLACTFDRFHGCQAIHVDGTGRLQTVTREANPRYHRLISAFRELTGIPLVLNTSFNENEPIVRSPQEALDCFLRTEMDLLVMGNRVITRRG